jgi:hypothetical protein
MFGEKQPPVPQAENRSSLIEDEEYHGAKQALAVSPLELSVLYK